MILDRLLMFAIVQVLAISWLPGQETEQQAREDSLIQSILDESEALFVEEVDQRDLVDLYAMDQHVSGWYMATIWQSFQPDEDTSMTMNKWPGMKHRLRVNHLRHIQFRSSIEQDPGESMNRFPDHISAGLMINPGGFIRKIAVGDYHVNLGFGGNIGSSPRYEFLLDQPGRINPVGKGIRLHSGGDENRYLRGIATQLKLGRYHIHFFFSGKRVDARVDTLIRKLQNSGYHRTESEIANRKSLPEEIAGIGIEYQHSNYLIGLTGMRKAYPWPFQSDQYPERTYSFHRGDFLRFSSYVKARWFLGLLFGEVTVSPDHGFAGLFGFHTFQFNGLAMAFQIQSHESEMPVSYTLYSKGSEFLKPGYKGRYLIEYYPGNDIQLSVGILYNHENCFRAALKIEYPIPGNWVVSGALYFKGPWTSGAIDDEYFQLKITAQQKELDGGILRMKMGITIKSHYPDTHITSGLGYVECLLTLFQSRLRLVTGFRVTSLPEGSGRLYEYESDVLYAFSIPSYSNSGCRVYLVKRWTFSERIRLESKFYYQTDSDKWGMRVQMTVNL